MKEYSEENYLLTCLMEECGELIQAASKCIRHGTDSHHPDRPGQTNWHELKQEITDVKAIIELLNKSGDGMYVDERYYPKIGRILGFLGYSEDEIYRRTGGRA